MGYYNYKGSGLATLFHLYSSSLPVYKPGTVYVSNGVTEQINYNTRLSTSDTWVKTVDNFPYFKNGSSGNLIKIGSFPRFYANIQYISTAGTYSVERTDSALTFRKWSTTTSSTVVGTYSADDFNDGTIPTALIVCIQAGGGGGWYAGNNASSSSSGAGGGAGSFKYGVMDFSSVSMYKIYIGAGGAGGKCSGSVSAKKGSDSYIATWNSTTPLLGTTGGSPATSSTSGGIGGVNSTTPTSPCYSTSNSCSHIGGNGNANADGAGISSFSIYSTNSTSYRSSTYKTLYSFGSHSGGVCNAYAGGGGASVYANGGDGGTPSSPSGVSGTQGSGGGGARNSLLSLPDGGDGGDGCASFYY